METVVSIISEKFHLKRIPSCLITVGICVVLGMLSVLGYSAWDTITIFGYQMLDFFDFLTNNIMMPIVALLTCLLIGYVVGTKYIEDEVLCGEQKFDAKLLVKIMLRFVCPVCMIIILITPFVVTL